MARPRMTGGKYATGVNKRDSEKPTRGFEPRTHAFRKHCSTAELSRQVKNAPARTQQPWLRSVAMSKGNSTPTPAAGKPQRPSKPYPEYPLTPHPAGQWCKKIRGKIHYFGPWSDPDGALARYLEQKDALHAGRKPRESSDGVTVKDMANAFLNHKKALLDAGELSTH